MRVDGLLLFVHEPPDIPGFCAAVNIPKVSIPDWLYTPPPYQRLPQRSHGNSPPSPNGVPRGMRGALNWVFLLWLVGYYLDTFVPWLWDLYPWLIIKCILRLVWNPITSLISCSLYYHIIQYIVPILFIYNHRVLDHGPAAPSPAFLFALFFYIVPYNLEAAKVM